MCIDTVLAFLQLYGTYFANDLKYLYFENTHF